MPRKAKRSTSVSAPPKAECGKTCGGGCCGGQAQEAERVLIDEWTSAVREDGSAAVSVGTIHGDRSRVAIRMEMKRPDDTVKVSQFSMRRGSARMLGRLLTHEVNRLEAIDAVNDMYAKELGRMEEQDQQAMQAKAQG